MIFGLDISTSIVGVSTFENDGTYVRSSFIDLRKIDDKIQKVYNVEVFLESLAKERCQSGIDRETNTFFVEDKLSNFAGGRSSRQTVILLASFNAVVSYLCWRSFYKLGLPVRIEHIHPSTVKAIMKREGLLIPKGADKKKMTLAFVQKNQPGFPVLLNRKGNPQPYCFDMADSWITARSGILKSCRKKKS